MATSPAGKKPAPRKTSKKPAAAVKKPAGKAAPTPKGRAPAPKKTTARTPAKAATKTAPKPPPKPRAAVRKAKPKPDAQPYLGLTEKQQRFVDEYLVDLNGTQAAIRAGYSANTAAEQSYEHLRKPHIQLAIAEARKRQQERTQITADRVVFELGLIAFADARELAQVKTGCCRHCWGEGFKYQRTLSEYNRERELWLDKGKDPIQFDEQGGIGFNALKLPHPECPECGGDGAARVVAMDTRKLSPQAAALYAGAKHTKEGIEIKMHSKLDAIEKLARHLGIYEKDNQQKTDPLSALLNRIAGGNGNGFTPVQVDPESHETAAGGSAFVPRQNVGDDDGD